MGMTLFGRVYAFRGGALVGHSEGGSLEYEGDDIPVVTLESELAGKTIVPKRAKLTVNKFLSSEGASLDEVKSYLSGEFNQFLLQTDSGLTMKAEGWINAPSITWSATDSTKVTWNATVEAKPFEGGLI